MNGHHLLPELAVILPPQSGLGGGGRPGEQQQQQGRESIVAGPLCSQGHPRRGRALSSAVGDDEQDDDHSSAALEYKRAGFESEIKNHRHLLPLLFTRPKWLHSSREGQFNINIGDALAARPSALGSSIEELQLVAVWPRCSSGPIGQPLLDDCRPQRCG